VRALLAAGLVAALAAPAACGSGSESESTTGGEAAAAETDLRITVWPQGPSGPSRSWTLRCGPAGGTLPNARRACTTLSRLDAPFRPVPRDAMCTQQYGGPDEALVRGTYRGRRVWARFHRRDGCHIARWDRVRFLFPAR
jgi:hypothetical protein